MFPGIQDSGAAIAAAGVRSPGLMDLLVTANELYKDLTFGKRNRQRAESDADNLKNLSGYFSPQYAQEKRAELEFPLRLEQTAAGTKQALGDARLKNVNADALQQLYDWSVQQGEPFSVFELKENLKANNDLRRMAEQAAYDRLVYEWMQRNIAQANEQNFQKEYKGLDQDFTLKLEDKRAQTAKDIENIRRGTTLPLQNNQTQRVLDMAGYIAQYNPRVSELLQEHQYLSSFPTEENIRKAGEVMSELQQIISEAANPGTNTSSGWDGSTPMLDSILNFMYDAAYPYKRNRQLDPEKLKDLGGYNLPKTREPRSIEEYLQGQ